MPSLTLKYPVQPFHVNQGFGENAAFYAKNIPGLKGHNGLDLLALHGQPVYASHDGVAYNGVDDKLGHGVVLYTTELFDYKGEQSHFKTISWHFLSSAVKDGQTVKAGELIGFADNTGLSSGDHLHFGLKPVAKTNEDPWAWYNLEQANGFFGCIDPAPYLKDKLRGITFDANFSRYLPNSFMTLFLQQFYRDYGFDPEMPITGFYGPRTCAATVKFCQMTGIAQPWYGGAFIGPRIREKINAIMSTPQ